MENNPETAEQANEATGAGQHVKALGDAFRHGIERGGPAVFTGETGRKAVAVPSGFELLKLPDDLFARPSSLVQRQVLYKPEDAAAYINRYKNDSSIILLAPQPEDGKVCARCILDYHEPTAGGQRFGAHVVDVVFRTSWQFRALQALTKRQPQGDFALALREIAPFCASMAAADVLELARSLSLTAAGEFRNFEDEFSGGIDFAYSVKVKASAGTSERKLTVPNQISWLMPILLGGKVQEVVTDFTYSIPSDPSQKVSMALRLNHQGEMLQKLSDTLADELRAATGLLTITAAL